MAGRVITIAQRKGGAGKTTLAAQLVIVWARQGARIAVLDIDPQGSLAGWVGLRRARFNTVPIGFEFAALSGWRAAQWIEDRAREADLVVVDSPPNIETESRIAVRAAGLVLVPTQPSPLDLWATEATLAVVRDERRPAIVVLNRVPQRSSISDRSATVLKQAGASIAETRIGNRIALVHAMAAGLGVVENAGTSPAAAEIERLAEEIRSVN